MKELINLLMISLENCADFFRAVRWSKASPFCPKDKKYYYEIILQAHTVEKGLSVTNPRMKFGRIKIEKLLNYLNKYDNSWDIFPVEKSYGCLLGYMQLHKNNDVDLGKLGNKINAFLSRCELRGITPKGGVKLIEASIQSTQTYEEGLLSRYSSRRYKHLKVDDALMKRITDIALRTPSQCNRQTGRIHYFSDKETIDI